MRSQVALSRCLVSRVSTCASCANSGPRTLAQAPDLTCTRAAVGLALQRMLPQEAAELARWLSAPQHQTAQQLVRAVGRLVLEDMRKLAEWVRAPHQALAGGAVRAFKGLMQDRGIERGGQ